MNIEQLAERAWWAYTKAKLANARHLSIRDAQRLREQHFDELPRWEQRAWREAVKLTVHHAQQPSQALPEPV